MDTALRVLKEFAGLVRDLGFPIVVAAFLLVRLDGTLQALRATIETHTEAARELTAACAQPPPGFAQLTRTLEEQGVLLRESRAILAQIELHGRDARRR